MISKRIISLDWLIKDVVKLETVWFFLESFLKTISKLGFINFDSTNSSNNFIISFLSSVFFDFEYSEVGQKNPLWEILFLNYSCLEYA